MRTVLDVNQFKNLLSASATNSGVGVEALTPASATKLKDELKTRTFPKIIDGGRRGFGSDIQQDAN